MILAFLSDHRSQILAAAVLCAVAAALLLWFGATSATAFRDADPDSDTPAVMLVGFTLVSVIGFVAVSMYSGMTYAMTAPGTAGTDRWPVHRADGCRHHRRHRRGAATGRLSGGDRSQPRVLGLAPLGR